MKYKHHKLQLIHFYFLRIGLQLHIIHRQTNKQNTSIINNYTPSHRRILLSNTSTQVIKIRHSISRVLNLYKNNSNLRDSLGSPGPILTVNTLFVTLHTG